MLIQCRTYLLISHIVLLRHQWTIPRRVASRYDGLAANYLAFFQLASIRV
jgi:hypothetical protein